MADVGPLSAGTPGRVAEGGEKPQSPRARFAKIRVQRSALPKMTQRRRGALGAAILYKLTVSLRLSRVLAAAG